MSRLERKRWSVARKHVTVPVKLTLQLTSQSILIARLLTSTSWMNRRWPFLKRSCKLVSNADTFFRINKSFSRLFPQPFRNKLAVLDWCGTFPSAIFWYFSSNRYNLCFISFIFLFTKKRKYVEECSCRCLRFGLWSRQLTVRDLRGTWDKKSWNRKAFEDRACVSSNNKRNCDLIIQPLHAGKVKRACFHLVCLSWGTNLQTRSQAAQLLKPSLVLSVLPSYPQNKFEKEKWIIF